MKILLTGGAGFIGSHTAVELMNSGYDVVIADDLSNSSAEVIGRIGEITGRRPAFYCIDVRDRGALDRVFEEESVDGVIHFAGCKAVGESVADPLKYYDNNINATLSVLGAMKKHGVRDIVFSSSAAVYGTSGKSPFDETMDTGCVNPYGWTKFMIERIITDMTVAEDFHAALLRYFNPIGAHPSGLMGEDPNGIPNNLMPYISQVAMGRLDEVKIFGNDYDTVDGTGVRDYIHVVDLAKGHVCALRYLEGLRDCAGGSAETVNLGTGRGYSVLEVIRAFEKACGRDIPFEVTERREGDIATCYADVAKAKKIFGWEAGLSLDDMCRDAWRWQTMNPEGYSKERE